MSEELVLTKSGKVKGKFENAVYKWFGIPYAKKPIGELRFRHAQPVENWSGTFDATKIPNRPIQSNNLTPNDNNPQSEDCLNINIWSSGVKRKKPVFFWILGGAFIIGDAMSGTYDGTEFAKEDIVVVTINYRVGIFGGYDLSMFSNEKLKIDSNLFISDVVMALKWVKENIEAFGGDPNNVTVGGVSSGGTTAISLVAVPEAKGLFHQIICESGIPNAVVSPAVAKKAMKMLLDHMGVPEDRIEEINKKAVEEWGNYAFWLFSNWTYKYPGMYLSGPVIGDLLTRRPLDVLKEGGAKDIKLLIGTSLDDASMFVKKKDTNMCNSKEMVEQMFKNNRISEGKRKQILSVYPNYPSKKELQNMGRDINFTVHSSLAADYQSRYNDTYMYRLDYSSLLGKIMGLGAFHAQEVAFAFDTIEQTDTKVAYMLTPKKRVRNLVEIFQNAWVSFIKTGNPNGKLDVPWPKYEISTKKVYVINQKCRVENDPYKKVKDAWSDFPFYEGV